MSGGGGAGTASFVLGGDLIRHQRLYDPSGSSSGGGGAQNTDYTTEDTATTVTNGSATCKPPVNQQQPQAQVQGLGGDTVNTAFEAANFDAWNFEFCIPSGR